MHCTALIELLKFIGLFVAILTATHDSVLELEQRHDVAQFVYLLVLAFAESYISIVSLSRVRFCTVSCCK